MSSIGSRKFEDAFDDVAELLNDSGQEVFTDAVLLKLGNQIYNEIQSEFAKRRLPFIETTTTTLITYAANGTTLTLDATLTDLQEPLEIWERQNTADEWNAMTRLTRLPAPSPTAPDVLSYWEWNGGAIRVNPCSRVRLILCRYRRTLAYQTVATGAVGEEHVYWALVFGTAWLGAISREHSENKISRLEAQYRKRLQDAIRTVTQDLQGISVRQRPYRTEGGRSTIVRMTE